MAKKSELDFKKWVRKKLAERGVWSESFEPRLGSGVGIPDIMFLSGRVLFPVELKLGSIDQDGVVRSSRIRPDQIAWHKRFADAGGASCCVIGVELGKHWSGYIIDGGELHRWRAGWYATAVAQFHNDVGALLTFAKHAHDRHW